MRNPILITGLFVGVAAILVGAAAWVQPSSYRTEIFSDQGEEFFPNFKDAQAVQAIEVVDYDEAEATARPLKVELRKNRWVLSSHADYPAEARDRLAQTSAALLDLKRDLAVSDLWEDQAQYGVIDPLDAKSASLTGRGKRVTLRGSGGATLAELVLGKPAKDKPGYRYARLPGRKRIYAVKTDADPSARFEDWVEADLLRVSPADITKMTLVSYSIDEQFGRIVNLQRITMVKDGENWNAGARTAAATLSGLRVVGARAKPKMLADQLRARRLEMTLETVMSMRQRGYFIAPTGQLLANEGELVVETTRGFIYHLRFGELASTAADAEQSGHKASENRFLFVTVSSKTPETEAAATALDAKFADWYYIIRGEDFARLRPGIKPRAEAEPRPPGPVRVPAGQPPQQPTGAPPR
jgi:hypothetical protein